MPDPTTARLRPLPMLDAATQPFFEAAREGQLLVRRCNRCEQLHWYPRPLCPYCLGDTEWMPVSGRGTIYSVSVARRIGPEPYAMAYVRLDEGVTMLTNVVHDDLDVLRIDQRVEVVFLPAEEGWVIPMFRPVDS